MFFEGFYRAEDLNGPEIIEHFYVLTLSSWIMYNEASIYEELLDYFESQQEFYICEGINRALNRIDDTMQKHFLEASALDEDDEGKTFDLQEYKNVSRRVFIDIMKEIYERQIESNSTDN